ERADRRAEGAAEEQALERDVHDAAPLRQDPGHRREHVRDRERERLEERPAGHADLRVTTSLDAPTTASTTTAWSTSTSSLGTMAWIASAPCESVPNRIAASSTPAGCARPSIATAMPMNPTPLEK